MNRVLPAVGMTLLLLATAALALPTPDMAVTSPVDAGWLVSPAPDGPLRGYNQAHRSDGHQETEDPIQVPAEIRGTTCDLVDEPNAQAQCADWVTHVDGTLLAPGQSDDVAALQALSPDGSILYLIGTVEVDGRGYPAMLDVAVTAIDTATGDILWSRMHDTGVPVGNYDVGHDRPDDAVATAEGVVVAISSKQPEDSRYHPRVLYLDATDGGVRQEVVLPTTVSTTNRDLAVAVDETAGTAFVAGTHSPAYPLGDWWIIEAVDLATGDVLWNNTYDRTFFDDISDDVVFDPTQGRLYVIGGTTLNFYHEGDMDVSMLVAEYDAATGDLLAEGLFNPHPYITHAIEGHLSPDGSTIFLAGYGGGPNGLAYHAGALSTTALEGQFPLLWGNLFDGGDAAWDIPWAAAVAPDGSRFFVGGQSGSGIDQGHLTRWDMLIAAFDATDGNLDWVARHDRGYCDEWTTDIAATATAVYFVGPSVSPTARGAPECHKAPNGVAAAPPAGRAWGLSVAAADPATGSLLWSSAYAGGYESAVRVGATADAVFVTGDAMERLPDRHDDDLLPPQVSRDMVALRYPAAGPPGWAVDLPQ